MFFTNVDLTPAEISEFEAHARSSGFAHIEIFHRERLRITLDSPRGLALRYQHLGIALSEPEQAAFFSEYGTQLKATLNRGFSQVEARLYRLEFFHDATLRLDSVELIVELKREFSAAELGHFRVLVEFLDLHEPEPHPTLWLACRDANFMQMSNGSEIPLIGLRSLSWSRHPDESLQNTAVSSNQLATSSLNAGVGIHRRGPFLKFGDLDRKNLSIYTTESLFKKINGLYIAANEYWIAGAQAEAFVEIESMPLANWPEPLTDAEANQKWTKIMLKMDNPPVWIPPNFAREDWGVDFRKNLPIKKT